MVVGEVGFEPLALNYHTASARLPLSWVTQEQGCHAGRSVFCARTLGLASIQPGTSPAASPRCLPQSIAEVSVYLASFVIHSCHTYNSGLRCHLLVRRACDSPRQ